MNKGRVGRKDKLIKEKKHDMYMTRSKISESTWCSKCGAVFMNGRWTWIQKPDQVQETICPACRRTMDNYPAGFIDIEGDFYIGHRDEIINLISNVEVQEKKAHPMERILAITKTRKSSTITTTGVHLARRIGEALSRSYKGEYNFQYADQDKIIKVFWKR
jgi:NMD protein affecting ribosome stability and mRNA decay